MDPVTKQDLQDAIRELKVWIMDRENAWIKWVMGVQITYFVVTLGAIYFMVKR